MIKREKMDLLFGRQFRLALPEFERMVQGLEIAGPPLRAKIINRLILIGPVYNTLIEAVDSSLYREFISREISILVNVPGINLLDGRGLVDFELDKFIVPKLENMDALEVETVVRLCTDLRLQSFGKILCYLQTAEDLSVFLLSEDVQRTLGLSLFVLARRSLSFGGLKAPVNVSDPLARLAILHAWKIHGEEWTSVDNETIVSLLGLS